MGLLPAYVRGVRLHGVGHCTLAVVVGNCHSPGCRFSRAGTFWLEAAAPWEQQHQQDHTNFSGSSSLINQTLCYVAKIFDV